MGIGEWGNDKYSMESMVNLFLFIIQSIKHFIKLSNNTTTNKLLPPTSNTTTSSNMSNQSYYGYTNSYNGPQQVR
jgi:hypothetical protein